MAAHRPLLINLDCFRILGPSMLLSYTTTGEAGFPEVELDRSSHTVGVCTNYRDWPGTCIRKRDMLCPCSNFFPL